MSPKKDNNSDSFEESLEKLQQIVTRLETGNLGLDNSLAQFETGIGILRHCYQTLEAAEQKIEMLTGVDADGNPITENFDATATFTGDAPAKKKKRKSSSKKKKASEDDDNAPALF